jgi:aarF domain-containing kinase
MLVGQWAATRPDIFPRDLSAVLSRLHDHVPYHPINVTLNTLIQSLGGQFIQQIVHFDPVPVGSGCIAQVHIATIRPSSSSNDELQRVAIKVMHPGIRESIRKDLAILSFFAAIIDALPTLHWLSLPEEVAQFQFLLEQQLDLRIEANRLDRFRENFKAEESNVVFPRPVRPWVSTDVLVEEFMDGN